VRLDAVVATRIPRDAYYTRYPVSPFLGAYLITPVVRAVILLSDLVRPDSIDTSFIITRAFSLNINTFLFRAIT